MMSENGKTPTLRIYIAKHCPSCEEAMRLAQELKSRYVKLNLELIDLDMEGSKNLDDVFSVPTYVLDGRTFALGNPAPDELFSRLAQVLARSNSQIPVERLAGEC